MEKILIILIILLIIVVLILLGITIAGKKKKTKIESISLEHEKTEELDLIDDQAINNQETKITEEIKQEEPVIEEPVIELDSKDELEQTREQTEVIEIISSMQEKAKDLTDKVADYEDEQEENAIISYTELLNAVKAKKEVQEEIKFEVQEEPKQERPYDDSKKFRSSEAISPLGRINNVSSDSYKSTIKPSNMQDEDFLKSLKDFRSNL